MKVAMIGAGSVVFSKNLTGDILSYPEFRDATFAYMDIDRERLEVGARLCRQTARALGAKPTLLTTLDRREALKDADFVINMVQIGGFDSTLVDFEIPRKYGLNFTIADTTGPGGLFRALRTYPMLTGLVRDMQALCPRATLLNYSNPMCMNMRSIAATGDIPAVGLCHSVQGTFKQLMRYIGEKPEDMAYVCAGINHMAFYLRMEKDGADLYPRLFEAMQDPSVYATNRVRFELMRRLGYFITESSEHNAEYNPWFIPHGEKTITRYGIPIDEYLRRCDGIVEEFERLKSLGDTDVPQEVRRSQEYGSIIIHSMATGTPSVVYGNQPNRGSISNLPADAIVEVPVMVDRSGMHPTTVGELPPQLLGYMMPHVIQHELFIRAAKEGRRDHVYQACMYDPLTGATLSPDQVVEMCDELIAAHGDLLPALDKPTRVPTSGKQFPLADLRALRRSWDEAFGKSIQDFLTEWHVLAPVIGTEAEPANMERTSPMEETILSDANGAPGLNSAFRSGTKVLQWTKQSVRKDGSMEIPRSPDLNVPAVSYAYSEIDSIHAREAVLKCGSSDGIRIWLNGTLVHEVRGIRYYTPGADSLRVSLQEGVNRIMVKHGMHGCFSLQLSRPTF